MAYHGTSDEERRSVHGAEAAKTDHVGTNARDVPPVALSLYRAESNAQILGMLSIVGNRVGTASMKRNRFLPWIIGLIIIVIADGYLLYFLTDEGSAELPQQAALVVIPIVYLALMYLTFKSQE